MGVGAGLVALGGLTGCTSLDSFFGVESGPGTLSALGAKPSRSGKAFAKLNKKLLKALKQQVKEAIQTLKKGDNASAISSARQALEHLFSHYNEMGLTEALEQEAVEGLKAFKGLNQEVMAELSSMGIDEREIRTLEEGVLKVRNELLSRPQIHVAALMNDVLAALRRLESRLHFQAEAQTIVSAQGFWGCLGSILVAVAAGVAAGVACSACGS